MGCCRDLIQFQLFLQGFPNLIDGISLGLVETANDALFILPHLLDLLIHNCLGYLGGAIEMQGAVGVQTEDEEVPVAHLEHLERLACRLFIQDLNVGISVFFESDNSEEALVECHFGREVLLDSADQVYVVNLAHLHQVHMSHNEKGIESVLFCLDALQTHIRHVFHLVSFQSAHYVVSVLKTGEQLFSNIGKVLNKHGGTCAILTFPMVINASRELFAALVGREHISEEDISIGTYEIDLTSGCFFIDGPLSDESIGLLCLDGQELFAGIAQHSYFLLHSHEDAHLG